MASTSSAIPLIEKLKEQYAGSGFHDYQKRMARRRVVDELSKLILNQPVESENESSSNLFKILVRRFKTQLGRAEKDAAVCDTAARKLAKFVETIMKEAYFAQRQKRRSSSIRSYSAVPSKRESGNRVRSVDARLKRTNSKESGLEKNSIIKGLGFADSKTSSPVLIEKVPRSFAQTVTKCGPLYSAKIDGRKVYVQEVKEGDSKKALISRVNSESTDPCREWSSWLVDLANKTKEWIKWLDEKASLVDSKQSNIDVSSQSHCRSSLGSDEKFRGSDSGHEKERGFHRSLIASSSESSLSDQLLRPSTARPSALSSDQTRLTKLPETSINTSKSNTFQNDGFDRRNTQPGNFQSKRHGINEYHFSTRAGSSNKDYTFSVSKNRPSTSI